MSVQSLPVRGAWIEIKKQRSGRVVIKSLPVRGAWIEIILEVITMDHSDVAPRKGSVD